MATVLTHPLPFPTSLPPLCRIRVPYWACNSKTPPLTKGSLANSGGIIPHPLWMCSTASLRGGGGHVTECVCQQSVAMETVGRPKPMQEGRVGSWQVS